MNKSKNWFPNRKRVVLTCLFVVGSEVYFCDFAYFTGKQLTEREYVYKTLIKKNKQLKQPLIRVYQLKNNEFTEKEDFPVNKIYRLFNFCVTVNKKVIFDNPALVACIQDGNLDFLKKELLNNEIEPEVVNNLMTNHFYI